MEPGRKWPWSLPGVYLWHIVRSKHSSMTCALRGSIRIFARRTSLANSLPYQISKLTTLYLMLESWDTQMWALQRCRLNYSLLIFTESHWTVRIPFGPFRRSPSMDIFSVLRFIYPFFVLWYIKYWLFATYSSFDEFAPHLHTNTIGPTITAQKLLQTNIPVSTIVFKSSDSGSAGNFREIEDGFVETIKETLANTGWPFVDSPSTRRPKQP